MTTEILTNPFAAERVTKAALKVVQERADFWVGHSGETITGAETAAFLQAVREVLEKRGWARVTRDIDPELPAPDESLSAKQMILTLWRCAREVLAQVRGPLDLSDAWYEVDDTDARIVAKKLLDRLVTAYTGASFAQATSWSERPGRTWDEVRSLLDAGADFARTHGPRA